MMQSDCRAGAFAFFDVDETLVAEKTMFTILAQIGHHLPGYDARAHAAATVQLRRDGADRARVNRFFYSGLKGLEASLVRAVAQDYVAARLAENATRPFLIEGAVAHMQALARRGVAPVFVSGSARWFVEPIARALAVPHVLATELAVDDGGRLTGALAGDCMIGPGKRRAVETFLQRQDTDAGACFGLGDHPSDVDFLSLLGHPAFVAGNEDAEAIARRNGWPLIPNACFEEV
ncbi:HAD-IB family hydrolase [Rhodobacter capsulatus]|uniref:HAD-IB family hydrolase n=1 Tax=Rhodobacter capsulatus TaxID=1061 RepID=A0A4U1JT17_RHOCA|nr:HAD-IB family hydrolase [Rhodobacter capsulatus]TKD18407.1 HAD-IB family hydrolase [Rhodobacter capsulatus]